MRHVFERSGRQFSQVRAGLSGEKVITCVASLDLAIAALEQANEAELGGCSLESSCWRARLVPPPNRASFDTSAHLVVERRHPRLTLLALGRASLGHRTSSGRTDKDDLSIGYGLDRLLEANDQGSICWTDNPSQGTA